MSNKNAETDESQKGLEKDHASGQNSVLKDAPTYTPDNVKVLRASDAASSQSLHSVGINEGQTTFSQDGPYSPNVKSYYAGSQEKAPQNAWEAVTSDKRYYRPNATAIFAGGVIGGLACSEVPILIPVGVAAGAAVGYTFDQGLQRLEQFNLEHAPKPHIELPRVPLPPPSVNIPTEHRHHEHKRSNS